MTTTTTTTTTTTKIQPGYKLTEVGVIPEDWDVKRIGDHFDFKNGLNKAKEFFGSGKPIVNYMDVFGGKEITSESLHGRVNLTIDERKRFSVRKGDVFFTRTSETIDEIGMSAVCVDELKDTVFSGFVLRGRPLTSKFTIDYCRYCFAPSIIRKQIVQTASITTRALTNGRLLSEILMPLPPTKSEQTAIATALSDMDALIAAQEQLIAKKCAIKQGAMQELLEAKEGWEEKKLGDICSNITTGKLDANAMRINGEYRFYTCARNFYRIDKYAFDDEALLISGNGENVGYVHYYKGKFNAYQRTYVLTGFKENIFFLKVYLDRFLPDRIDAEVNLGNTPYIKMDTLTDMKIKLPQTAEEQTRIAQILSDMDTEIEQLGVELAKLRGVKKGMMEELLTGAKRLSH